jgi:hypothetical protein
MLEAEEEHNRKWRLFISSIFEIGRSHGDTDRRCVNIKTVRNLLAENSRIYLSPFDQDSKEGVDKGNLDCIPTCKHRTCIIRGPIIF